MKFLPLKTFLGPVIKNEMPFAPLPRPTAPIPNDDSESDDDIMKPLPMTNKPLDITSCCKPVVPSETLQERISREIAAKIIRGWTKTPSKKFYVRWSHREFKVQSRPVTADVVEMFRGLFLEAKQKKKMIANG